MPRTSAAARLVWLSYPLSVIATRGRMSGPISSDVSNSVLSLASPPVRWKSRGLPSRSVLRWIFVEKPPRERPNDWCCCFCPGSRSGHALLCCQRTVSSEPSGFCPGGRNVGTRCCAVKELYQVSRLAAFRQHLEECLEYPGATEPPKPLPYAVPFAIFPRECAPRYAVHSEVVNGF